jgi:ArsR family transcriptional regulator, virulence genes transcriptional regulator
MKMEKMHKRCNDVASLLKNFSHPQRLLILCFLADGEKQVTEIYEEVGLSQSQTSQFLKRMESQKLLKVRREKNYSFYSIANPKVLKLLRSMQDIFG